MKVEQVTKRQHFVPQFYLKRFVNQDGQIEVLNIVEKRIEKPKPPKSVAYSDYFYAMETGVPDDVSQDFETMYRGLENEVGRHWERIINNTNNKKLDYEDCYNISWFLSMQYTRTPAFREQMNSGNNDVMKQITRWRSGTKEIKEDYKRVARRRAMK